MATFRLMMAGAALSGLLLAGCGNEDPHAGHDHGPGSDHSHGPNGEHIDGSGHTETGDDAEMKAHSDMGEPVDITIAGSTFAVAIAGEAAAGTEVHVDIHLKDGDAPAAVRLWVGDEAGTGAMKSKADGSGGDYHGHVEVPADVAEGAMLWIEIETADGERHKTSTAF